MSAFKTGEDLYDDAKFSESYHYFIKAFEETPNNQLIYPYIVTTAFGINEIEYFLSYPFRNYLITDIWSFENYFDETFWESISIDILKKKVPISNLSRLILDYFNCEKESRFDYLDKFIPEFPIDEYWQSILYLSIYGSFERKRAAANIKLEKCLSIYNKCPLPYFLMHFLQHPIENTTFHLDKAIEIKPDYFEALKEKAWIYFIDGCLESYEEAIKTCDNIMYLNPTQELLIWALEVKGCSLIEINKFSEGIICFNQSLQIDEDQMLLYLYRGSARNRMKKYPEALLDYLKFVELKTKELENFISYEYSDPEPKDIHPQILIVIGTIYLNLQNYFEAINYYTNSIEKNNNYSIAYFRRATAFQAINQKMLAEGDIRMANKTIHDKNESRSICGDISSDEL